LDEFTSCIRLSATRRTDGNSGTEGGKAKDRQAKEKSLKIAEQAKEVAIEPISLAVSAFTGTRGLFRDNLAEVGAWISKAPRLLLSSLRLGSPVSYGNN
jgi:hypothetical protein